MVLTIREEQYIDAARTLGASTARIMWRHILPNASAPIIVQATVSVSYAILAEAGLSFLGLGVQAPDTSWGVLIKQGAEGMEDFPWLLLFPAAFFSATLFSLNFIGDGLRDALDPKSSKD